MQIRAGIFLLVAAVGVQTLMPASSLAEGDTSGKKQAGEDRWVPSLVITAGATIQKQRGALDTRFFDASSSTTGPLQIGNPDNPIDLTGTGDDIAVAPFFGVALELMTPALPIPTRPRFFIGAEILPTFASDRNLAIVGAPKECIRGPGLDSLCVKDMAEPVLFGDRIEKADLTGEGARTTATIDTLVYGANLGVSFPLQFRERQLRIKPSVAWISYKVNAIGEAVVGQCGPDNPVPSNPAVGPYCLEVGAPVFFAGPGDIREIILTGDDSRRFHGVGPGLDVELDVGVFGPIGAAIFLGARAYAIMGDRTMSFSSGETTYDDAIGTGDTADAFFDVEVDPWMYRAHVGVRFQWLGGRPW